MLAGVRLVVLPSRLLFWSAAPAGDWRTGSRQKRISSRPSPCGSPKLCIFFCEIVCLAGEGCHFCFATFQSSWFFLFFSQRAELVVLFCLLLCLSWITSQSPSSQYLLLAILALVHPEVLISFSLISLCYHTKKKSFFFGKVLEYQSFSGRRWPCWFHAEDPRPSITSGKLSCSLGRCFAQRKEGWYYLQSKFSEHAEVKPKQIFILLLSISSSRLKTSWFSNRKLTDKKTHFSILASHWAGDLALIMAKDSQAILLYMHHKSSNNFYHFYCIIEFIWTKIIQSVCKRDARKGNNNCLT